MQGRASNLGVEEVSVAKILPDKEVRKLLGTVILNADESRINPNGIEIRLGKSVLFQSTDEERNWPGHVSKSPARRKRNHFEL